MPESAPSVRSLPFLSVPAWDISDEEIAEWRQTPGKRFAGYTAACIRDGKYAGGQELYPPGSVVYQETTRGMVDQAMSLLAERGMARKAGGRWLVIAPGRMEPDIRRAIAMLVARRDDLPPALAAELDSWKHTLDTLQGTGSTPASQVPAQRAAQPAKPTLATSAV